MVDDRQQLEADDTVTMLHCAFPHGLQAEDYLPLLFALYQHEAISHRAIAMAVTTFLNGHYNVVTDRLTVKVTPEYLSGNQIYPLIMSDLYGVIAPTYKDQVTLQRVIALLKPCGYDEWLKTP
jgi:hypothetical protein